MKTVAISKAELYVSEAASLVGCSSFIIYRLIRDKKLPAHKEGNAWKILVDDLENWMRGHADTSDS